MKAAHKELDTFMREQIQERKSELRGLDWGTHRQDVFSMLIRANEVEPEEIDSKVPKLGDQELVGRSFDHILSAFSRRNAVQIANVFVLLFAGHETTAHTLASVLGLLGTHPEIQEEVFAQIIEIVGHDRDPVRISKLFGDHSFRMRVTHTILPSDF